jgi:hypothetical protein
MSATPSHDGAASGPKPRASAKPYFFRMHQGTGVAVRSMLNDLPFYRGNGSRNMTVSGPANHLLLPGENTFTVEVYPAPRPAAASAIEGPVVFKLAIDSAEATIVHRVEWPELWEALPADQRFLPCIHTSRFHVDEAIAHPAYWDAPPARFGLAGLPAQHEAVREVFRAFHQQDGEAFFNANALKLEERQRAYPDNSDFATGLQRQKLDEQFGKKWDVRPVDQKDFNELVFESRCGGRVAYVTRADGGSAIEAVAAGDPTEGFAADLFLTQRDGRWRVFR